VVPIYGDAAEVERLRARMVAARPATTKDRRADADAAGSAAASAAASAKRTHMEISAGVDARAIVEQAEKKARTQSAAVKSLFSDPSQLPEGKGAEWISRGVHFSYIS
jgi:hypothetical protein